MFSTFGSSPRLVAILAGAAISAAAAVLIATGTFSSAAPSSNAAGQNTADPSSAAHGSIARTMITVGYNRSGGTLNSIDLTVNPSMPDAQIRLQVLHTDVDVSKLAPGVDPSSNVVYTEVVSATNTTPGTAAAANGPSSWSGTLDPSRWKGGCQSSGFYDIRTYSGGPGAVLTRPASIGEPPVDGYNSGWFSCSGSGTGSGTSD